MNIKKGVCLMKQEMYNWREMPLPIEDRQGSHGFPQVFWIIYSFKEFALLARERRCQASLL